MKEISPTKDDLQTYFYVVFCYLEGLIPLRSFAEKNNVYRKPHNIWIKADDDMASKALSFALLANQKQMAFYVIPGTVKSSGQAGKADIKQMQVLLIDIDSGNTEDKLILLSKTLGEPTLIIESGGITEKGCAKLHIYWQLSRAAINEELQKLIKLRHDIALSVSGDLHFKSANQPIRVAGSIYHKGGIKKLVKIRLYSPVEYDLAELITNAEKLPKNIISDNQQDFSNKTVTIEELLISKVYEGGEGEQTRFNHLSRVIGYWLRRTHDGLLSYEQAIEEIYSYNLANVVPSWQIERIKQTVNSLWQLHIQKYGEPKKPKQDKHVDLPIISSFTLNEFLADQTLLPDDIIAPRILTPGGMFIFGGAPKVGKSDFLLALFVHLAAGQEFIGFAPPRPLKIFYFQAEIGYHYLKERLQKLQLTNSLISEAKNNLYITPNTKLILDEIGIKALINHIKQAMLGGLDIIAIDPIRNVFDGGRTAATENENDAMLFFLQKRIEVLRNEINPEAGIILVHHTKKINKTQFEEDPFQAFSGASSLRSYYTSGALLYKPDAKTDDRHLIFELRNGSKIPTKIISKKDNKWLEEDYLSNRIAYKNKGTQHDRERERRITVIQQLLEEQALKGKFYLMQQFAEKFRNCRNLGGKRAIYDDCSVAATQGLIKFFNNPENYGIDLTDSGKGFGFMCTQNMKIQTGKNLNSETGEMIKNYITIVPTHFKRDGDGKKIKI